MIVAELRIIPVGNGSSMEKPLEKVINALKDSGVRHEVGSMGTTLEAKDLKTLFDAVRKAHEAIANDTPRILTELSIDHRLDKEETMESLSSVQA